MIRPIATSLPGMIRDEKMTVSPSTSLSSCVPGGDAAKRGARLALPAGGDDQHLLARQAHRFVERNRRREILQIAGRLGDAQDAVERAPGDAHLAAGLAADPADGLEPRGIGRKGGDEHAALGLGDLGEQPGVDAFLRTRRLVLEDVGGIAHQREHARDRRCSVSTSVLGASPITGVSSIFQSPVWKILPNGVSISRPLPSGIECDSATKLTLNGPSSMVPPRSTMLSLTCPVSPSSSSLPAISPAVNGVA